MSDLISRKAAIKAIRKDMYADKDYMSAMICEGIEDVLNGVPSAEPERKTPDHGYMWICPVCGLEVHSDFSRCVRCGWDRPSAERKNGRWIKKEERVYYWYECSECGAKPLWNEWRTDRCFSAFCPNCGARMEEKEDET